MTEAQAVARRERELRSAFGLLDLSLEHFKTKDENIKKVFDDEFYDFYVDSNLVKRIKHFLQAFKTKNSTHINFFGTGLLGVHLAKWLTEDKELWWDYVLQYDGYDIENRVHALPTVNKDFIRASDITNISMVWLLHRIQNSNLPETVKMEAKVNVFQIMQIKFITSFHTHCFPYPTQENIAIMVYNSLSRKFELKVHGTWGNLIYARSVDLAQRTALFFNTYTPMDDDIKVGAMINDIQGRNKEIIKNLNKVFYSIKDDVQMSSVSSTMSIDGSMVLKDITRTFDKYKRYIDKSITDIASLVKKDLVVIIGKAVPSSNPNDFYKVLKSLNKHYGEPKYKHMEEFVIETLLYTFEFMKKRNMRTTDLAYLLDKLRAVIMASKNTEPSLLKIKQLGDKIVSSAEERSIKNPPAPDRTALILYIVARTLTMNHFN